MPFCASCGEPTTVGRVCRCGSSELTAPSGLEDHGPDRTMTYIAGESRPGRSVEAQLAQAANLPMNVMEVGSTLTRGANPMLQRDSAFTTSDGGRLDFSTKCDACKEAFNITDECTRIDGVGVFHQRCLVCSECALPLSGTVKERQGKLYCKGCEAWLVKEKTARLEELNALEKERRAVTGTAGGVDNSSHRGELCVVCTLPMLDAEGHRLGDRVFHFTCFTCAHCSRPFPEGAYRPVEGKPYHTECATIVFGAKAADKRCPACHKAIAPGQKFVKFEGKDMHKECFRCGNCGGDLSGGFAMMDGSPMCPACVRKPKSLGAALTGQSHRGFVVDPVTGQKRMM